MFKLIKSVLNKLSVPVDNIDAAYTVEEAFLSYCATQHDLVITDWLENVDSGIEVTKRIRTDLKSPNHAVPVIMTAGTGHENKVLQARDAGVTDYIVKPFDAATMVNRLERVIEDKRQFVISDNFVGPDRRRNDGSDYEGEERRASDAFYV